VLSAGRSLIEAAASATCVRPLTGDIPSAAGLRAEPSPAGFTASRGRTNLRSGKLSPGAGKSPTAHMRINKLLCQSPMYSAHDTRTFITSRLFRNGAARSTDMRRAA